MAPKKARNESGKKKPKKAGTTKSQTKAHVPSKARKRTPNRHEHHDELLDYTGDDTTQVKVVEDPFWNRSESLRKTMKVILVLIALGSTILFIPADNICNEKYKYLQCGKYLTGDYDNPAIYECREVTTHPSCGAGPLTLSFVWGGTLIMFAADYVPSRAYARGRKGSIKSALSTIFLLAYGVGVLLFFTGLNGLLSSGFLSVR